jgi:hypothetical protein
MLDLKVEELNAYICSSVDNAWMAVCDPEREYEQAHGRVGFSLLQICPCLDRDANMANVKTAPVAVTACVRSFVCRNIT